MFSSNDKYNDIINMPHHVSKTHPQMSLEARSAQFAPFAALTGYGDVINETGRLTNEKIEIDDELKEILNEEIMKIKGKLSKRLTISFTYFIPDAKKNGGKYVTVKGIVKKVNDNSIILEDKTEILIEDIIDITII